MGEKLSYIDGSLHECCNYMVFERTDCQRNQAMSKTIIQIARHEKWKRCWLAMKVKKYVRLSIDSKLTLKFTCHKEITESINNSMN